MVPPAPALAHAAGGTALTALQKRWLEGELSRGKAAAARVSLTGSTWEEFLADSAAWFNDRTVVANITRIFQDLGAEAPRNRAPRVQRLWELVLQQ